jgi:signal transduction histidine kinase
LQFDKAMQLSRIERGGILSLSKIELKNFIQRETSKYKAMQFQLNISEDIHIMADEFALQTILRNLIDNTKKHRSNVDKIIHISCEQQDHLIQITYNDHGEAFTGDLKQLGQLFYKFNSSNGTGIGLYIIKKLTTSMGGQLLIEQSPHLVFKIRLPIVSRGASDE